MQKRTAEKMAILINSRPGWTASVSHEGVMATSFAVNASYKTGSSFSLCYLRSLSNRSLFNRWLQAHEEGRLGAKRI